MPSTETDFRWKRLAIVRFGTLVGPVGPAIEKRDLTNGGAPMCLEANPSCGEKPPRTKTHPMRSSGDHKHLDLWQI